MRIAFMDSGDNEAVKKSPYQTLNGTRTWPDSQDFIDSVIAEFGGVEGDYIFVLVEDDDLALTLSSSYISSISYKAGTYQITIPGIFVASPVGLEQSITEGSIFYRAGDDPILVKEGNWYGNQTNIDYLKLTINVETYTGTDTYNLSEPGNTITLDGLGISIESTIPFPSTLESIEGDTYNGFTGSFEVASNQSVNFTSPSVDLVDFPTQITAEFVTTMFITTKNLFVTIGTCDFGSGDVSIAGSKLNLELVLGDMAGNLYTFPKATTSEQNIYIDPVYAPENPVLQLQIPQGNPDGSDVGKGILVSSDYKVGEIVVLPDGNISGDLINGRLPVATGLHTLTDSFVTQTLDPIGDVLRVTGSLWINNTGSSYLRLPELTIAERDIVPTGSVGNGLVVNIEDGPISEVQMFINGAWLTIGTYLRSDEYWVSESKGDDSTGNGARTSPFKTIQHVIDNFCASSAHDVIYIDHTATEDLTFNNIENVTIIGAGVIDSQQTSLTGNHTISGTSTRIRFKNILLHDAVDDYILTYDGSLGRHYNDNVTFDTGAAKKAVNMINAEANWHAFTFCSIAGTVECSSTDPGLTATFTGQVSLDFILNINNFCIISIYDTVFVNQINHDIGVLIVNGIYTFSRTSDTQGIVSIATAVTGSYLELRNVKMRNILNNYMQINKTGDCPYLLSSVSRDETNDVLTGTQIFADTGADINGSYTPSNYTETNDSIPGHLEGIDSALASSGANPDLAWVAATSKVTVTGTGTDATLTLADVTNPGLLSSAEKALIASALQTVDLDETVTDTNVTITNTGGTNAVLTGADPDTDKAGLMLPSYLDGVLTQAVTTMEEDDRVFVGDESITPSYANSYITGANLLAFIRTGISKLPIAHTSGAYVVSATDRLRYIRITGGTLSIPDSLGPGFEFYIMNRTGGTFAFTMSGSETLGSYDTNLKIGDGGIATLINETATPGSYTNWRVQGDTVA